MSYNSNFEREFIERSLALVQQYKGPFDATLLLNCLLGLLVVPKQSCLDAIPQDPIDNLAKWGISRTAITSFGKSSKSDDDPPDLRRLVRHLRNAVAHFRFKPVPSCGEITAFHFHDTNGFEATVPLLELRNFVERLASHIRHL